ncbi:MAG: hypothetical protein AMXMBFR26_08860 [Porticoccaceae bacterium]
MVAMRRLARLCGAMALLHFTAAQAGTGKVIAGWLEKIQLAAAADHPVKAKLDSGAKTSSINAHNITPFTRDGAEWVRFELVLEGTDDSIRTLAMELPLARYVKIKRHGGQSLRRPVVDLEFCFGGRWWRTEFSLVDRGKFHYPVLLGRRFLGGVAVIDPGATFIAEPDCKSTQDAQP